MLKVVMYSSENIHSHDLRGLWKFLLRCRWEMVGERGGSKTKIFEGSLKPPWKLNMGGIWSWRFKLMNTLRGSIDIFWNNAMEIKTIQWNYRRGVGCGWRQVWGMG